MQQPHAGMVCVLMQAAIDCCILCGGGCGGAGDSVYVYTS